LFLYYLRTGQFAKVSSKTSNVAHLGAGRFAEMPFPMPSIDVQRKFAERRRKVVALHGVRRSQVEEANDLFGSLVQRAFRAEL
jgi:type I restriction enzyme S subunit